MYPRVPEKVRVRDVTLRDGLQNLSTFVPTHSKIELYHALVASGVGDLQVTSFVNPARIPQFADAEALWGAICHGKQRRSVLVANQRGFERALTAHVTEVEAVLSLSETYNNKNAHRSVRQSLDEILEMARLSQGTDCKVTVAIGHCYHCVFEGWIEAGRVFDTIGQLSAAGVREICICDTTGYATPDRVFNLSSQARAEFPKITFGAHLHDTRGRGIVNAIAALNAGITWFDAALAGLGGSPFAPGIGGNLSLESLSDMLAEMHIETGIDVSAIFEVAKLVQKAVAGSSSLAAD